MKNEEQTKLELLKQIELLKQEIKNNQLIRAQLLNELWNLENNEDN